MNIRKPILSLDEQIAHLKENGILFNIMNEDEAKDYLAYHNNYFKLTAYRKNYPKHPDGKNKGKYIKLEFAYLVDLAIIDMNLRYQIVHMALDIEHHTKLQLLQTVEAHNEDGYQIVQDYINSLSNTQKQIFDNEITRNRNNIYCGSIINKYDGNYPVWAFIEIIPFGRLVSFYYFCAIRFDDPFMKDNFYRLRTCKEIRNAAAHSNCILNDLSPSTATHNTNTAVTKELISIPEISPSFRKTKMSNARIQQVITLLYTHKTMVKSDGVRKSESKKLNEIVKRINKHFDYYSNNPKISSTLDFFKLVVDNWFDNE